MQLSVLQTQELLKIIDRNQLSVIVQELGAEFLTDYDRQLLKTFGVDVNTLFHPELSSIQTSWHFGMLSEALGQTMTNKLLNYEILKNYIREGNYIPVTRQQQATLDSIKMQTFSSLKALNGNIFSDINNILTDRTREGQQEFLAQELKEGLAKRRTVAQISHDIAWKTGDWNRNFDRIIESASQTAFEEGKAAEMQRRNPDRDPLVYKHVKPGACKHCIRLYLTGGLGSKPLIFKLSDLRANGDNIGRKTAFWLAVIGVVHPWCRCELREVPQGFIWNPDTNSFSTPDPDYRLNSGINRPLIKVTIDGKEMYL